MKKLVVGLVVAVLLVLVSGAAERGTAEAGPGDPFDGIDVTLIKKPANIAVGVEVGAKKKETEHFITGPQTVRLTGVEGLAGERIPESIGFLGGNIAVEDSSLSVDLFDFELNGLAMSFTSPGLISVSSEDFELGEAVSGDFDLGEAVLTLTGGTATVVEQAQEGGAGPGSCADGIDNDDDGLIDGADPDCAVGPPQAINFEDTPKSIDIPESISSVTALPVGGGPGLIEEVQLSLDVQTVLFDLGGGLDAILSLSGTPTLVPPPPVGGMMYWTDSGTDKIQRTNLDGTAVIETLVTAADGLARPIGIALDLVNTPHHMYWTDGDTDKIRRATLAGDDVTDRLTGASDRVGLALDLINGKMYWADFLGGKIERANLDGSMKETLVNTQCCPVDIALDVGAGEMYWTLRFGVDKIQRATLAGDDVTDLLTAADGLIDLRGIALDLVERQMYWVDNGTNKIQRANLNGTGVTDLVTSGLDVPLLIALDVFDRKMYWTDAGNNTIKRAARAVDPMVTILVDGPKDGLEIPIGIALDVARTPQQAIENVIDGLQDIVNSNSGTPLADKVEDALANALTALNELTKTPPDNQAAMAALEGAVGDLEASLGLNGPAVDAQLTDLMGQLAGAAKVLAQDAIDAAIAGGGDPDTIVDAQQFLADGDADRAAGQFKDAVAKYKDAKAKAESA